MHRVSCDRLAPTPWRNGAGLTRDLLHWPDLTNWQVRISVADIARREKVPVNTIYSRIWKARQDIADAMAREDAAIYIRRR